MDGKFLIGLDVGGGGGRCLTVHVESGRTAPAFRTWKFQKLPELPTASEIDTEGAWHLLGECLRASLDAAGADPERVAGIAATGMRHASAVLDAEGNEILATSNQDARGLAETLGLAGKWGEELHRRTGHWPNPVQAAGRLRWMAREDRSVWRRAAVHLSLSDWLANRLCGQLACDPSQASETLLFDLATRDWAWDLIDRLDLPRRLFPAIREPGSRLGALNERAAADLGLRAGIPVAVGGGDTQCGLLGAGVVRAGEVGIIAGTSAPVQLVLDRPVLDDEARLWSAHHVIPGHWVLESNAGAMGTAVAWIAGLLYPDAAHPIVHLFAEAAASMPGAAGMVSTFGAEVMNARQLGLPIGNLTLSYLSGADDPERRRHLARSIVEGLAFALRANVEQTETVAGMRASRLRLAGGLSRNAFFAQLVSDVLERPVEVAAVPEATALGAAICAGVGAGIFDDLADGAARIARVAYTCAPSDEAATAYRELYARWNDLRLTRGDSDAAASALAVRGLLSQPPPPTAAVEFRPKILVTAEMDETGLDALRRIGDVEYASFKQAMRLLTGPSLAEALKGVEIFVTEVDVVDAAALTAADDLRVVASCRGDAVNVDLDACTALKIPVLNAPGRNADAVADLTLTFLLMLARRLPEASAFLREPGGEAGDMARMGRAFGSLQGRELWHQTVGLVGMGAVGRKVVERLRPFGVRCLVYDPFLDADAVRLAGAEPASLDALLAASDFVSLHAAVADGPSWIIGERELARMRPGSFLVNTARSALVDQDALIEALRSEHLGGAALDVFAVEPPAPDDPLLALPNVIATPHIGGNTAEVAIHQGRIIAEDLERLRAGEAPRYLLNPEVLEDRDWAAPRPEISRELLAELQRREGPAVTDLEKKQGRRAPSALAREAARAAPSAIPAPDAGDADIRSAMERVLRAFVDGLLNDDPLREFAADREVVLHFALTDLGLEFHFGFRGGAPVGGADAPDEPADVQLKMRADLLDGIFTGRLNPMQAAMNGELSFSGDTAKAMTFTQIQSDMERVYKAVIAEVGEPGDLASVARPAAAAEPPAIASAASAAAEPATAASTAPASDVRHQLIEVVNELYAARLITATGGNASVRSKTPGEVWITPSQLFKGDLRLEVLVRVGMDGRALDAGTRSPSSEAAMHTAVLEAKPEAQAVIHCHAPNATVLVNSGLPFLPVSTEAAFLSNIGRIPFVMPGTRDLAAIVVEAMGDGWAVLMQNHGLLVAGRSPRRAADMAEIIEQTAEVILGCYAVGKEPPVLPPETVEMLAKMGNLMA